MMRETEPLNSPNYVVGKKKGAPAEDRFSPTPKSQLSMLDAHDVDDVDNLSTSLRYRSISGKCHVGVKDPLISPSPPLSPSSRSSPSPHGPTTTVLHRVINPHVQRN